jgi:hypothetical protein
MGAKIIQDPNQVIEVLFKSSGCDAAGVSREAVPARPVFLVPACAMGAGGIVVE